MSQVTFHVDAPDKTAYACRLLRKAVQQGAKVLVTGEPLELDRLDVALWTFAAREFVPHCRADASQRMVQASPIVLAYDHPQAPGANVLVHLGGAAQDDVQQFEKVIEVVGQDPHERQEARQRWRSYTAQGHEMRHHAVTFEGSAHG